MMSEFTSTVIQLIRSIPPGKVATYKQIAQLAGKPQASRGVSWILHSCSTSHKLPWHRVLNSKGTISFDPHTHNFRKQRKLLSSEGVEISTQGALSLAKYQWKKKPKAAPIRSTKNKPRMFSKT